MLTFTYMPEAKCVELKSLKLYLQQFRNEGIFYEHVTNRILDDLVAVRRAAPDDARGRLHAPRRHHDQRDGELRSRQALAVQNRGDCPDCEVRGAGHRGHASRDDGRDCPLSQTGFDHQSFD